MCPRRGFGRLTGGLGTRIAPLSCRAPMAEMNTIICPVHHSFYTTSRTVFPLSNPEWFAFHFIRALQVSRGRLVTSRQPHLGQVSGFSTSGIVLFSIFYTTTAATPPPCIKGESSFSQDEALSHRDTWACLLKLRPGLQRSQPQYVACPAKKVEMTDHPFSANPSSRV